VLTATQERENATAESTGSCVSQGMVEPRGIEPHSSTASGIADSPQYHATSKQTNALHLTHDRCGEKNNALPQQNRNTSVHEKCATCVQQHLPADLAVVVEAWDRLTAEAKLRIVALADSEDGSCSAT
jgi:hypothetical protein